MSVNGQDIFSSVIIPTVGRSTLTRAVASVLAQSLPASELEVIVVNDSGAHSRNRKLTSPIQVEGTSFLYNTTK